MLRFSLQRHELHFRKPAPTSRGVLTSRELWVLAAEDDDNPGHAGRGECGPIPGLGADDLPDFAARAETAVSCLERTHLAALRSNTLDAVAALLAPFDFLLRPLPSLCFALESALLDLAGGGRGVLWESDFTRGNQALATHGLIWMDSAAGVLDQVEAKVAAGFGSIKMKVGALDWATELALLREIRMRHPSIELRLDANGAFAPEDAAARLDDLAPLKIRFLEQPLRAGKLEATAELCRRSSVPIALDEELIGVAPADAADLLADVRPAHVVLKPALLGGFAACSAWIDACRRLGVQWWINSLLESAIGHSAICQWTAVAGEGRVHGLGSGGLFVDNFASPIRLDGSRLRCDSRAFAH